MRMYVLGDPGTLFTEAQPDAAGRDFRLALNPRSVVVTQGWLEPGLAAAPADQR